MFKKAIFQLLVLLLLGLLSPFATAAIPIEFRITELSFQVDDYKDLAGNTEKGAAADRPIHAPSFFKYLGELSQSANLSPTYNRDIHEAKIFEVQQKLIDQLKRALSNQSYNTSTEAGVTVYRIADGVRFYRDFFTSKTKDPALEAALIAFYNNPTRRNFSNTPLERMLGGLLLSSENQGYLLSNKQFAKSDIELLKYILAPLHDQIVEKGDFYLVGSGLPFELLKDVMNRAETLTDPKQIKAFKKAARFMAQMLVPAHIDYIPGAVASFRDYINSIDFLNLGLVNLEAYAHEMTHARFARFEKQLKSWAEAKDYAVPFQLDGSISEDKLFGESFGPLLNLFDELNAFRTGFLLATDFQNLSPLDRDQEILKILDRAYGKQAGRETLEIMKELWSAEKVFSLSVPSIILNEFRALNKMSPLDILELGRRANDLVGQMNFLRLVRTKKFPQELIATAKDLAFELAYRSPFEEVKREAIIFISGPDKLIENTTRKNTDELNRPLDIFPLPNISPGAVARLVDSALATPIGRDASTPIKVLTKLVKQMLPIGGVHPDGGQAFFAAFDEAMNAHLFDSIPFDYKADLLDLIIKYVSPSQMPKLYSNILSKLKAIKDEKRSQELSTSLSFLEPPLSKRGPPIAFWGLQLMKDLKDEPALNFYINQSILEFIRNVLAPNMDIYENWGTNRGFRFDHRLLKETRQQLSTLSDHDRSLSGLALVYLLRGLMSADLRLRQTAIYSAVSKPILLLLVQEQLIAEVSLKNPFAIESARKLIEITGAGFLDKLAIRLAVVRQTISPDQIRSGSTSICNTGIKL